VPTQYWLLAVGALMLFLYRLIPERFRCTDRPRGLAVNAAFLVTLGGALLAGVVQNGYTCERLGIGLRWLPQSTIIAFSVTAAAVLALFVAATRIGNRTPVTPRMLTLVALYTPWAYAQELLGLGIALNLLYDCLGTVPAVLLAAAGFQAAHHANAGYRILTGLVGGAFAAAFLAYPNLLPFAVAHAVIGTLNFYWVQSADKWQQLFGPRPA